MRPQHFGLQSTRQSAGRLPLLVIVGSTWLCLSVRLAVSRSSWLFLALLGLLPLTLCLNCAWVYWSACGYPGARRGVGWRRAEEAVRAEAAAPRAWRHPDPVRALHCLQLGLAPPKAGGRFRSSGLGATGSAGASSRTPSRTQRTRPVERTASSDDATAAQ